MERCLVVANKTLSSDKLRTFAVELVRHQPGTFHLLAPATTPSHDELRGMDVERRAVHPDEAPGFTLARHRVRRAMTDWTAAGLDVDGEVGDPDLLTAIRDSLDVIPADLIVLSTLPRHQSRWLMMDPPARLLRATGVPVLHLESDVDVRSPLPAPA
jgi:hypothetical protein